MYRLFYFRFFGNFFFFFMNHWNTLFFNLYHTFINILSVTQNFFKPKYEKCENVNHVKKSWLSAFMILEVLLIWDKKIKWHFNLSTCSYRWNENKVKILKIELLARFQKLSFKFPKSRKFLKPCQKSIFNIFTLL